MKTRHPEIAAYLASLDADRSSLASALVEIFEASLPEGFEEDFQYRMPSFVVPKSRYPAGYHVDPKLALPFIAVASQKNFIGVYHLGLYAVPEEIEWFREEFAKTGLSPDMGKSCIRLNPRKPLPLDLFARLAARMTCDEWIRVYESKVKPPGKA